LRGKKKKRMAAPPDPEATFSNWGGGKLRMPRKGIEKEPRVGHKTPKNGERSLKNEENTQCRTSENLDKAENGDESKRPIDSAKKRYLVVEKDRK